MGVSHTAGPPATVSGAYRRRILLTIAVAHTTLQPEPATTPLCTAPVHA
ncbi:hypothetical protein [Streptomyces sp. CB01881]|nr:hypothetical protein [Streptomyces sp. CB01881]